MKKSKLAIGIIVIALVVVLALVLVPVIFPKENPWLETDTLADILSEESIGKANHFYFQDKEIEITPELAGFLQPETWTQVDSIHEADAQPILTIQYTKFEAIHIYDTYVFVEDGFVSYGQKNKAYFVLDEDISAELTEYLEKCEEVTQ